MRRYRTVLVAAAATSLVSAGAVGGVMNAAAASSGCSVTYKVTSQWQTGFQADVSFTNLGDPLSSWKLEFDFGAGQTLTQGWNATWSQSSTHVTATNMSYNGSVPTNGTVSALGFLASWTGSNPVPAGFSINGTAC